MTRLRTTFQFRIGELWVRRDELGSSHVLAAEPLVRLHLPSADQIERWPSEDSPFTGGSKGSSDKPPELRGVRHVRMTVEFSAELSAADFPTSDRSAWPTSRAYELYDEAYEHARDGYKRFRDWARVSGDHHWLGTSADDPEFVGIQSLEDLDAGQRIPVGYPAINTVMIGYNRARRERVQTVASIVQLMKSGDPPLAATLLADAQAIYSHRAEGADHQRAVLLAAIASEIAIKERLRALASPDMAELVDIVLSNPREVTQSPPQLLHMTCKAITGVSLHQQDKPLFNDVELRLFKLRNALAHRGQRPTADEGRTAVDIAVRLQRWLSSLEAKRA